MPVRDNAEMSDNLLLPEYSLRLITLRKNIAHRVINTPLQIKIIFYKA